MATQEAAILRNLHGAEGWRERSGLLMTTHEAANLLGLHGAEGWEGKIQLCVYGLSGGRNSA